MLHDQTRYKTESRTKYEEQGKRVCLGYQTFKMEEEDSILVRKIPSNMRPATAPMIFDSSSLKVVVKRSFVRHTRVTRRLVVVKFRLLKVI